MGQIVFILYCSFGMLIPMAPMTVTIITTQLCLAMALELILIHEVSVAQHFINIHLQYHN